MLIPMRTLDSKSEVAAQSTKKKAQNRPFAAQEPKQHALQSLPT